MNTRLKILLVLQSGLQTCVDFSHVLLMTLIAFCITTLSKDSSLTSVLTCVGLALVVLTTILVVRWVLKMKPVRRDYLKNQLLLHYSPSQTEIRMSMAKLIVLSAGSAALLALIGSWAAVLVTIWGNVIVWFLGKLVLLGSQKGTNEEEQLNARSLMPWRATILDAVPLFSMIGGFAVFPDLLDIQAIPIFLILRHTCRHVFEIALKNEIKLPS